MKKLKLESLEVTSFETLPESQERGTVQGHNGPIIFPGGEISDTDPNLCWFETNANLDCTYGCSQDTACDDRCVFVQP